MTVREAMDTVESIIATLKESNDTVTMMNTLKELEAMKYQVSRLLAVKEATRFEARRKILLEIVNNPDLKKIANSSTLTQGYIDGALGKDEAAYNALVQMLRNIRTSLDSTRTLISAEKAMAELAR